MPEPMKKRTYVKPEITVYLMHTAPTLLAGSDINQSMPNGYSDWNEESDLWGE